MQTESRGACRASDDDEEENNQGGPRVGVVWKSGSGRSDLAVGVRGAVGCEVGGAEVVVDDRSYITVNAPNNNSNSKQAIAWARL